MDLSSVRHAAGMTQVQLAECMGMRQVSVSQMERQSDWLLSTLASYLKGVGASAVLVVDVNGSELRFQITSE